MVKIWFQGLNCEETELSWARSEETRGLNIIKPTLQGLA